MRLALDAMGGDHAPQAIVDGGLDYARAHPDQTVILVGRTDDIERCLQAQRGPRPGNVEVHHAPDVIGMGDKIQALKDKPDDSMNACARLVKDGVADGMVLCGNTGCSVAAAQLHLRRIKGVKRAGILTPLPTVHGTAWVIDCGANATGKPEHLVQFGEMAAAFLGCFSRLEKPAVGLLNIGSEEDKGDDLVGETYHLLKESELNFKGNIEGNDIFKGTVDVVVCDGFTGNIVLKSSEGVASAIGRIIEQEIRKGGPLVKLGYLLMKPAFAGLKRRTHWSVVGGCLLLGVNGVTVIGHGRSDRVAVAAALGQAARCVETQVIARLTEILAEKPAAA
jgi:glycerol-3-phosphate acyltransferase PlsX